ncbi:MAG: malto-oligosyltrehalose trehalohydrolase [Candidatus Omnitrophica bacterium]|nr:malto-oligosyltrehalose trehalohydrolase [Candidatus Omnitrophota bacterium]
MQANGVGAYYQGNGACSFRVWAPVLDNITLHITSPKEKTFPLHKDDYGYWTAFVKDVFPGTRYCYYLNNTTERPDPASFFQPDGVHSPSQVISHQSFTWSDGAWHGVPLEKMIIYELHTGTFTVDGTFAAIISKIEHLLTLGINTIELMPVAQFPGERNWGYDGVYPFAVQNSYGGPDGLKQLVDECHQKGIAVILDVVYNHVGPEGNYLSEYGPYFTQKYKTPWGAAINFDDAYSYGVRDYFIQNALYWFREYHIDGLRIDAIHGIFDMSAKHILRELAEEVDTLSKEIGKKLYLIAESDLNDVQVINESEKGGYGIDAQWSDDFHHAVHAVLTGEKSGYYEDFGTINDLVTALQEGFVYSWKYSPYRKRYHGSLSHHIPAHQFVIATQNHDQVGNRMRGDRLCHLVSFEAAKLAAGILFCSPYIPMLFMGEEWAADAPFLYFVSHSDPCLVEAVRKGRKEEFRSFGWLEEPSDPQSEKTFKKARLGWDARADGKHKSMFDFYRQIIQWRKEIPALHRVDKKMLKVWGDEAKKLIVMERGDAADKIYCIMNFKSDTNTFCLVVDGAKGVKIIDSSDTKWSGPGSRAPEIIESGQKIDINPFSFILYTASR